MDKYATLAEEQKEVINTLITGVNVFMTGCGGTGKSYVIQSVLEVMADRLKARGLKGVIHVTALTGCAALLLGPDAKTLHSWAGIGLGNLFYQANTWHLVLLIYVMSRDLYHQPNF